MSGSWAKGFANTTECDRVIDVTNAQRIEDDCKKLPADEQTELLLGRLESVVYGDELSPEWLAEIDRGATTGARRPSSFIYSNSTRRLRC